MKSHWVIITTHMKQRGDFSPVTQLTVFCISDWVAILLTCSKIGSEQYSTTEFRNFSFNFHTFFGRHSFGLTLSPSVWIYLSIPEKYYLELPFGRDRSINRWIDLQSWNSRRSVWCESERLCGVTFNHLSQTATERIQKSFKRGVMGDKNWFQFYSLFLFYRFCEVNVYGNSHKFELCSHNNLINPLISNTGVNQSG